MITIFLLTNTKIFFQILQFFSSHPKDQNMKILYNTVQEDLHTYCIKNTLLKTTITEIVAISFEGAEKMAAKIVRRDRVSKFGRGTLTGNSLEAQFRLRVRCWSMRHEFQRIPLSRLATAARGGWNSSGSKKKGS